MKCPRLYYLFLLPWTLLWIYSLCKADTNILPDLRLDDHFVQNHLDLLTDVEEDLRQQMDRTSNNTHSRPVDVELVIPRVISDSGYNSGEEDFATGSPDARETGSSDSDGDDEGPWERQYFFRAFDRPFHLRVFQDSSFLAPTLVVRHARGNVTWLEHMPPKQRLCYFRGFLTTEPNNSQVTLHVCNGLVGRITMPGATFFIEPAKNTTNYVNNTSSSSAHLYSSSTSSSSFSVMSVHVLRLQRREREQHCHHAQETPIVFRNANSVSLPTIPTQDVVSKTSRRSKRSMSNDLHIEVMVTADSSMSSYHGEGLRDYVLTLMSIVAQIFRDASLGNSVTVSVVKIIVTDENEESGFISTNAPRTLRSFCKWQAMQNYGDDSFDLHYDVAILLTRVDICRSAKKCDTLGLADLGTMCNEYNSCAIIEDNGLSAAFTVAHELGHVLNLPHDDDLKCVNITGYSSSSLHVMARFLDLNTDPWSWSTCSSHYLTEFLDTESAKCLQDKPGTNHLSWKVVKGELPGQSFNADRQCELLYGFGSRICPYMPTCSRLWCLMPDTKGCRTHHMPWADGTLCSQNHWCFRGKCLPRQSLNLKYVDGGWGEWSEYGECSRTCGGGIKRSVRHCNNPRPSNGGKYCIGERVKYLPCRTQTCPPDTVDFREQQCTHFNSFHFTLLGLPPNIRWVPKYSGIPANHRCKLYCRISTSSDYFVLRDKVIDGTLCGLETYDICVNGKCMPAGCDHKLFSKVKVDNCGECGGKNQNCRQVSGKFNSTNYGYNRVVSIPPGSVNIDVKQMGFQENKEDDNYLALLSDKNEYILNGEFTVTTTRKRIEYGGAVIEYTGSNVVIERVNSSRPLQRLLIVEVLSVGKLNPPDIRYQYSERVDKTGGQHPKYHWEAGDSWSNCTALCGGVQGRKYLCFQKGVHGHGRYVSDHRCRKQSKPPPEVTQPCNVNCELSWAIVSESECLTNSQCGEGIVRRKVVCQQQFNPEDGGEAVVVDPAHCEHLKEKPPTTASCVKECHEHPIWEYTAWAPCSKSCDGGIQTRKAICKSSVDGRVLTDEHCRVEERKLTLRPCAQEDCPHWQVGTWTNCSKKCNGERQRPYWCQVHNYTVSSSFCDSKPAPVSLEPCFMADCYLWDYGPWSKCSATCGEGVARRLVRCRTVDGDLMDDSECEASSRPLAVGPCFADVPCPEIQTGSVGAATTFPPPATSSLPSTTAVWSIASDTPSWKTGPWSQCSVTCGAGVQKRQVICLDQFNAIVYPERCNPPAPFNIQECYHPCGQWVFVDNWSSCSKSCGGGSQWRVAVCHSNGEQVDLKLCRSSSSSDEELDSGGKPPVEQRACSLALCPRSVRWKRLPWSQCSKSCTQTRVVHCADEERKRISDDFCYLTSKPSMSRRCKDCYFPYIWIHGPWSECSSTCGVGFQTRSVSCHAINKYGWVDRVVQSNASACNLTEQPAKVQSCAVVDCDATYRWAVDSWQPCSATCGLGVSKRRIFCVDKLGRKVARWNCKSLTRPNKKRKCRHRPCMATSCAESRDMQGRSNDGEYEVWVRGRPIRIFCADMNGSVPKEYVSLLNKTVGGASKRSFRRLIANGNRKKGDERENFSEVYEKRLIQADTCPGDGKRLESCECIDTGPMAGLTVFSKIRLNVTSLKVITNDFRFTQQIYGQPISYGEAGDCYSLRNCPQGKFSIDLTGTGLVVAQITTWISHGHNPHRRITGSANRKRITGQCGGYCGVCMPDPSKGLLLDVEQPS